MLYNTLTTHLFSIKSTNTEAQDSPTKQSTLLQFEMQTMTQIMNDYEVFGIFQPTCIEFLSRELKYESQVSDIGCIVTRQQLMDSLGRRRLGGGSLVVDMNFTGSTFDDDGQKKMDTVIHNAFADKSELFINELKNKGEVAEVTTFGELYSFTSVQESSEKSAVQSGSGSIEEGGDVNNASLIVIVTGVGLIVVVVAGLAISRRNKHPARMIEEETAVSVGPPSKIIAPKKEGGFNFDFGFLNSLSQETQSYLSKLLTPDEVVPKVRREVFAPRGKLGIITEDSAAGVIVHSLREDSPLEGLLFPGDLIEALDSMDISHLSSSSLTKLMISKSNYERKITVLSEMLHTNYSDEG
jgi:hypothetical protein